MTDISLAASWTRIFIAICTLIGSAEYLAIRSQFTGPGIFSDTIHLLQWTRGPRFLVTLYRIAYSHQIVMSGQIVRIVLALLLIAPLDMRTYSLVLLVLFAIQLQIYTQAGVGNDGSDQMLFVVTPSLAVAYGFSLNGPCAWIPLWFIVAQAVLAYETSGISKLVSPVWRSGRAIELIFNTAGYGSQKVSKLLARSPALALIGAWTVIIFECVFPFVLIAPKQIMILMLVVAVVFHVGCALTMGLNCFLWAFASTYSLLYLFNADRASALSGLTGAHNDKMALAIGSLVSFAIVAIIVIRYYELLPHFRVKVFSSQD